jgi:arginyl-tRNA synthetase
MSIFRRAGLNSGDIKGPFNLREPDEIALSTRLLQYPEAVESVVEDYQANILCNYLFDLSQHFMTFYESCPVLKADDEMRDSRLRLCDLSAKTLKHGLGLLGIQTVEHM